MTEGDVVLTPLPPADGQVKNRSASHPERSNKMTVKETAIRTIQQLPQDATWEDIQERINFVVGVRKGLRELDEGEGIAHEKVREEFAEWLSS